MFQKVLPTIAGPRAAGPALQTKDGASGALRLITCDHKHLTVSEPFPSAKSLRGRSIYFALHIKRLLISAQYQLIKTVPK
jgi:hypothetical protein